MSSKTQQNTVFQAGCLTVEKTPTQEKTLHLLSADLAFKTKTDIDEAKEIRSWRGYRHAYGLKVRGQRTKTTGRAGKALGVKKKTLMQKPGGAPQLKEANKHGRSKETE